MDFRIQTGGGEKSTIKLALIIPFTRNDNPVIELQTKLSEINSSGL